MIRDLAWPSVLLSGGAALAEPATQAAFDACKAQRRDMTARAMAMTDLHARGELLVSMPSCTRGADGTLDVTAPLPAAPIPAPSGGRWSIAASAGAARSAIWSAHADPAGFGPFVDLAASYRPFYRVSFGVNAAYASFRDSNVYDALAAMTYDVREASYDLLAVVHLHYGAVVFGGGLGVDYERYASSGYSATLPCAGVDIRYEVAHSGTIHAHILAAATLTIGIDDGPVTSASLWSTRLGVGFSL